MCLVIFLGHIGRSCLDDIHNVECSVLCECMQLLCWSWSISTSWSNLILSLPASLLSTAARRLLCVQSQEQLPQPWKNMEKPSLRMHLKLRLMGNNQTMKNSHGHCVSWRTPSLSNPAKSFVAAKVSAKPWQICAICDSRTVLICDSIFSSSSKDSQLTTVRMKANTAASQMISIGCVLSSGQILGNAAMYLKCVKRQCPQGSGEQTFDGSTLLRQLTMPSSPRYLPMQRIKLSCWSKNSIVFLKRFFASPGQKAWDGMRQCNKHGQPNTTTKAANCCFRPEHLTKTYSTNELHNPSTQHSKGLWRFSLLQQLNT